jgi:hypothetical protein
MKTSELTGPALDWAVAKAIGEYKPVAVPHYSTDWSQGGPIIEREKITIEWTGENWMGYIWHDAEYFGPTPLIAAMRCYVASKLGDEIELPKDFL